MASMARKSGAFLTIRTQEPVSFLLGYAFNLSLGGGSRMAPSVAMAPMQGFTERRRAVSPPTDLICEMNLDPSRGRLWHAIAMAGPCGISTCATQAAR